MLPYLPLQCQSFLCEFNRLLFTIDKFVNNVISCLRNLQQESLLPMHQFHTSKVAYVS